MQAQMCVSMYDAFATKCPNCKRLYNHAIYVCVCKLCLSIYRVWCELDFDAERMPVLRWAWLLYVGTSHLCGSCFTPSQPTSRSRKMNQHRRPLRACFCGLEITLSDTNCIALAMGWQHSTTTIPPQLPRWYSPVKMQSGFWIPAVKTNKPAHCAQW